MKSSKSVPKWKPKYQVTYNESKASHASSKTSSGEIQNASTTVSTMKLIDGVTSGVKRAPMTKQTYSSFMSGISDCSSCDQQHQTKAASLKSAAEDCETILQQYTNTFAQIGRSLANYDDARQIGVRCLEYANLVSFNIEMLEHEQIQAVDHRAELDKNLVKLQQDNIDLQDEINAMQRCNISLKRENVHMFNKLHTQNEQLDKIQEENNLYRSVIEDHKSAVKAELQKVANSSFQLERAVVEKDVRWDNLNYHLQTRVAELQFDRDQLKANYNLMCNALHVGNSGDVDNALLMDVSVLEADHEAEMVVMKYAHESFISELNKSNCKLWNEKFYTRSRLEEEMNKGELYMSWLVALQQENAKYRDGYISLNSQIELLLDDICLKLENVTTG
ncbi:hypothetical protein U1Q18_051186 [Sarracenia purpurea var. burkii]